MSEEKQSILPRYVEVELVYELTDPPTEIAYKFPRLRKADADLDEKQKMLMPSGSRMTPAQRLAGLIVDITGAPGLDPRGRAEDGGYSEPLEQFRVRALTYFSATDETQEMAEDALAYRIQAVYPKATFRGA